MAVSPLIKQAYLSLIHMTYIEDMFVLHCILSHTSKEGKRLYCAFIKKYIVNDNLWMKMEKETSNKREYFK